MSLTRFTLPNNKVVELVMPFEQGQRLAKTCFAGRSYRMAGNFFAWRSFASFLEDEEVRNLLANKFEELVADGNEKGRCRLELTLSSQVGWASVIDMAKLTPEQLKQGISRPLNNHTHALFLPENLVKAPKTNIVTMAASRFILEEGKWKFMIGTIYPGQDCGRLDGDMTQRSGLYWLHWTNLGAD